jgi:hypothetical protein
MNMNTNMNMNTEMTGSLHAIEASNSGDAHAGVRRLLAAVLALWLGLIFVLGARGVFVGSAGAPPLPIFFGFGIPLAVLGLVTTGPMAQLPLVLIPAYLVPIFILLHFTALAQVRQLTRSGKSAASQDN